MKNRSGKFSKIVTNRMTGETQSTVANVASLKPEESAEKCLVEFMEILFSGSPRYYEENYEEWIAEIYEDGQLVERVSRFVYEYPEERLAELRWMFEEMEREEERQIEDEIEKGLLEMQQFYN